MRNEQLISDLVDMFFEAKKLLSIYQRYQELFEKVICKFYK